MNVKTDDYIICRRTDSKKNFLMQVTGVREKEIDGMIDKDRHIEEEEMTVHPHQIIINLGPKPHPDLKIVAGVDVRDVYRKTVSHDIWGDIHFFTRPDKKVIGALKKSLDKTGEKLTRLGFEKMFPRLCTEIRHQRGRYGGEYVHKDGPKKINRFILYLKNEHAKEMNYILFHEAGHGVDYNYLTDPRVRSTWIRKFNSSIQVDAIEETELSKLLKKLLKADVEKLSQFRSSLDDREKLTFQQAIRFIQKIHHLGVKELSTLLEAQNYDTLESVWPTKEITQNELKPIVSDYACKNPRELFAEAFSFYILGKKIPSSISALVERSIEFAKGVAKANKDSEEEE